MKSYIKLYALTAAFAALIIGSLLSMIRIFDAYAATPGIPIPVPSAPGSGYSLTSTTTGAYIYTLSGNPTFVTQTAHGFSTGTIVRFDYDNRYHKASADTLANAEVVGIVTGIRNANTFEVTTHGRVTGLSNLASSTTYYLSESTTTLGTLSSSTPKLAGSVVKPLLIADSTTTGYFLPSRGNIQEFYTGIPSQTGIKFNPDNNQIIHWYNAKDYGCATTTGPTPVVIFVHGGGLDDGPGDADLTPTTEPVKTMLQQCTSIVGIQYSGTDIKPITDPFPAQLDVGRAIQYLRANAREFNIRPDAVGLFGISAGSILSQQLAYGLDLRSMNAASNTQQYGYSTKPDFFFQNKGLTYWPDLDQTYDLTQGSAVSGIIFAIAGPLSNVSGATQIAYSGTTLVDGAVARGETIIPTYNICADYPPLSPPIIDPHDEYYCELLAAKIESYGYTSPSPSTGVPTTAAESQVLIDWMYSVIGDNSHLPELFTSYAPNTFTEKQTFKAIVVNAASSTITNLNLIDATTTSLHASSRITIGDTDHTHVLNGTTYGEKLSVHAEGSTDLAEVSFHRHSDTALFGSNIVCSRTRNTEASETIVQSGDSVCRLIGLGYDGIDYAEAASIEIDVDGTPGSNDMPGRIVFKTTPDNSTVLTERLRISSTGLISSTGNILVNSATSTITNLNVGNATTTNATTTGIHLLDGGFIAQGSSTLVDVTRASSIFRAGTDTDYAQFFLGDLTFAGTGDYNVGNDRYAFRSGSTPNAGMTFNTLLTGGCFGLVNASAVTDHCLDAIGSGRSWLAGGSGSLGVGTTTPSTTHKLAVNGGVLSSFVTAASSTFQATSTVFHNLAFASASSTISLSYGGGNATFGTTTLVAGTATVNTTRVTANSVIMLTGQTAAGVAVGSYGVTARTPGTSFTITSTAGALDTSVVGWWILEPFQ